VRVLAVLVLGLGGCFSPGHGAVSITIDADGSGRTTIDACVSNWTSAKNRVTACSPSQCQQLPLKLCFLCNLFCDDYEGVFDGDAPDSIFTVIVDDDSPASATLPTPFELTSRDGTTLSHFPSQLDLIWTPSGSRDVMHWRSELLVCGNYNVESSGNLDPSQAGDPGQYTISSSSIPTPPANEAVCMSHIRIQGEHHDLGRHAETKRQDAGRIVDPVAERRDRL
jgi:hypothetical protein